MYDDEYNRGVANKVLKRSQRKALNVDRLNGAGARTANDGDRTKHPASYWFKQENEVFKDDITRPDVEPESVVRERSNLDLGAGRCRGGMVGMPDRGALSNVEPNSVIRERAGLDLGAGRSGGGMSGGLWGALAGLALPLIGQLMGKGNSGGIANMYLKKEIGKGQMTKMIKGILPHGQKKMAGGISSAICREYGSKRGKGYSGGAQEFDDEDNEEQDDEDEELEGGALPLRQTGYGMSCGPADRKVGGKVCKCKCRCGSGMSGGYAPVAPTTESLYGYDNRNQPKGLKPPPSVNQQEGMGDAQYVGSGRTKGGFLGSFGKILMGPVASMLMGQGQRPASMSQLGRNMLPVSQLPSGTGGGRSGGAMMCPQNYAPVTDPESGQTYGNKCKMNAAKAGRGRSGGRSFANTTNYASNSGNILPSLQSRVSIGSGARSARGAMVKKLMQEKGMTLGEASRYIKEQKM
jgi:hypothetical protein